MKETYAQYMSRMNFSLINFKRFRPGTKDWIIHTFTRWAAEDKQAEMLIKRKGRKA